jgi:hypothetical protein
MTKRQIYSIKASLNATMKNKDISKGGGPVGIIPKWVRVHSPPTLQFNYTAY